MRAEPDNVAVNTQRIAHDCRIGMFPHILCNFAVKSFAFVLFFSMIENIIVPGKTPRRFY